MGGDLTSALDRLAALSDSETAVAVVGGLSDLAIGSFQRLRDALPADLQPTGPIAEVFTIGSGCSDAGAAVQVTAVRRDGRRVSWLAEVWCTGTAAVVGGPR